MDSHHYTDVIELDSMAIVLDTEAPVKEKTFNSRTGNGKTAVTRGASTNLALL
jgi:hypothetical protein